jgi:hypothetical protein
MVNPPELCQESMPWAVGLVEQAVRAEVAEDTSLDNVLDFVPALGL